MLGKISNLLKKLLFDLLNSLKRFPETIALTIGLVITIILNIHNQDNQYNEDMLINIISTLLLGMPLSATIVLICERLNIKTIKRGILAVTIGLILIGYYLILPRPMTQPFIILTVSFIIIFYLLFTLVPYFYYKKPYSIYCIHLAVNFFITYLYAIVLYAGIAATIFTMDQLFNLSIQGEIYGDLFIITAGLFGVTYFLGNLPSINTRISLEQYPKIIRVLFLTIVMPLLSLYTIILYVYFARILINQNWPENIVGNLVLWYGWIGMIILFFISELEKDATWPIAFKRIFPIMFIVPLGMLFSTIWIRTNAYGLTIARYYVWLSAIWFLVNVTYYIINKWHFPTFIITSLVIFILISAIGPVSSYHTSIKDQVKRLEQKLTSLNMLKSGKVIKRADLSVTEKDEINSSLYYLDSADALDKVPYLPIGFELSQTEEVFGYQYEYEYGQAYYNYYYDNQNFIEDISNYEYIVYFNTWNENMTLDINESGLQVVIDADGQLSVIYNDMTIATKSIYDIVFEINNKLRNQPVDNQDQLTYILQSDQGTIVIEWSSLYGKVIGGTSVTVDSMSGRIWVDIQ